jgi:peptide/nickel transport system permease protein
LPVSIELMLCASPRPGHRTSLGIYTAYKNGSIIDKTANITMFAMLAMPAFLVALGSRFGRRRPKPRVAHPVHHSVGDFPAHAVHHREHHPDAPPDHQPRGRPIAVYMRLLRSDMIATLQEDFITTAKSKGIPACRVLMRHAFRPSSHPAHRGRPERRCAHRWGHHRRADLTTCRVSATS